MAISRETVRDELATALATALTSAEAVYNHKPIDFDGVFPVVAVESVSSNRTHTKFGTTQVWRAEFVMLVHIFVLFSDDSAWTRQDADDAIDALEQEFAAYMETQPGAGVSWNAIQYNGETTIFDNVIIGGVQYINERIPIKVFLGA